MFSFITTSFTGDKNFLRANSTIRISARTTNGLRGTFLPEIIMDGEILSSKNKLASMPLKPTVNCMASLRRLYHSNISLSLHVLNDAF